MAMVATNHDMVTEDRTGDHSSPALYFVNNRLHGKTLCLSQNPSFKQSRFNQKHIQEFLKCTLIEVVLLETKT